MVLEGGICKTRASLSELTVSTGMSDRQCALAGKEQAGEATGRREKWGEFRLSGVLVAQPCGPSQCFSLLHMSHLSA